MIRVGVDFGGTKIEAAALDEAGAIVARRRAANPGAYRAAIEAVRDLVAAIEADAGVPGQASVGVGAPGSVSPRTGRMRNANSTWLNGQAFVADLEQALGRPVRVANDANCFALSEAADGAAAGARTVFGAILGTGCGGGLVVDAQVLAGRNGIAGEWGHTPLPWPADDDGPPRRCWCGRDDCLELYLSGPALAGELAGAKVPRDASEVVRRAGAGDPIAQAALDRYVDRLGRALAVVVDIFDPDAIVLGGGLSNVDEFYDRVPAVIARHVFSDGFDTPLLKAKHGDSSGVRGAAWLWPVR